MTLDYWIFLPADLERYRDSKPPKEERQAEHIDGSGVELRIITVLARKGWSDEGMVDYCDCHRLPRHSEDCRKDGNYSATLSRINVSRNNVLSYFASNDGVSEQVGQKRRVEGVEEEGGPPNTPPVIESEHNPWGQTYSSSHLRALALGIVRDWDDQDEIHKLGDWRSRIVEESALLPEKPVSMMTARRLTKALIESGYVKPERIDGRSQAPHLTEKGRQACEPIRGKWRRSISLKRQGSRVALIEGAAEEEPEEYEIEAAAPPVQPVKARQRRDSRHLHVEGYRKRNQINGHFRLGFGGNKIRYIQLLVPIEERVGGPVWQRLLVGYDQEGLALYGTVAAEEDPAQDPLRAVMPPEWQAREQSVIAAVELVKTKTGFEVAEHADETGELQPSIGLICQSEYNFFKPLASIHPNGRIIQVKGTGSNTKPPKGSPKNYRRFQFTDVEEALPIAHSFDFEQALQDILGPEHLDRALDVPKGWHHMPEKRRKLIHFLNNRHIDAHHALESAA